MDCGALCLDCSEHTSLDCSGFNVDCDVLTCVTPVAGWTGQTLIKHPCPGLIHEGVFGAGRGVVGALQTVVAGRTRSSAHGVGRAGPGDWVRHKICGCVVLRPGQAEIAGGTVTDNVAPSVGEP